MVKNKYEELKEKYKTPHLVTALIMDLRERVKVLEEKIEGGKNGKK